MTLYFIIKTVILVIGLTIWALIPLVDQFYGIPEAPIVAGNACPSGQASAQLTGWSLNGKMPSGSAKYTEATKQLEVAVASISLPNGKVLSVFIGEDRIAELPPLKDGMTEGTITRALEDGARVRVFDGDRPLLSANLKCDEAPVASPTPSPTTSTTPTASPTAMPTVSPTTSPTAMPTVSPTTSPTAMPTVSPTMAPAPEMLSR